MDEVEVRDVVACMIVAVVVVALACWLEVVVGNTL